MDPTALARTIVVATALAGCDPGWALKGSAHSRSGDPIPGAAAETLCPQIHSPRPTAVANANGEFEERGVGYFGDDCSVEVSAADYATQRFPVPSICTRRSRVLGCMEVTVEAVLARAPK
jgi:hypothetical protein